MFKKFQAFLVVLIFFIGLIINTALADSHPVIGKVSVAKGSVELFRNKQRIGSVESGEVLVLGDIIKTGQRARVLITLNDKTELTIGRESQVKLEDYAFTPKRQALVLDIPKGWFLYKSGDIAKKSPDSVKLVSEFATIGVRGTKIWGAMVEHECAVYVEDGVASVMNDYGSVVLEHGDGTRVQGAGVAPSSVKPWGKKAIRTIKREVSL
ncbi:MAG: FecR domain-containing protein [Alphaproteobacteria bacterium]|nr:FecR domain-containing protein [Alphaproteobacteria bacterium]MDD9919088.1 FecR domain-containing protein [Alphaproteobacteria bacterium]